MAITYPIALPTAQGFRRVTIAPQSRVAIFSSPFTGQQQIYQHPAQFLTCSIELPPMARAEAADFAASMLSLHGQRGTFLFGDPAWTQPRGTPGGLFPRIKSASQTGNEIVTEAWSADNPGVLLAGDWVQFGSQNLFTRSEDFTNATWAKNTVTVTGNDATSPIGTTTADRIEATGTDSFVAQAFNTSRGNRYVVSVWLRSVTGTVGLTLIARPGVAAPPPTGNDVVLPVTLTTSWQRFEIPVTALGASASLFIGGFNSFTTGEEIYAWGAQANVGTSAMAYQATTTATVTTAPQLCMVTSTAISDGSGDATLQIFPRIRTAYAADTPITVYNPVGVWRMVDDGQFLQDTDSLTRGIVINAVEAF
jgi:hypothetical protein